MPEIFGLVEPAASVDCHRLDSCRLLLDAVAAIDDRTAYGCDGRKDRAQCRAAYWQVRDMARELVDATVGVVHYHLMPDIEESRVVIPIELAPA